MPISPDRQGHVAGIAVYKRAPSDNEVLQLASGQRPVIPHEDEPRLRAAIVEEAYSWLGTPYGNCGDVKGPNGIVDCAMILVRVFSAVGILPLTFDPRPYNSNWHLHQDEARYMAGLEQWAHQVATPGIGDIPMYRFGRHASHGAIIVSDDLIIHAHKDIGKVMLCERRAMEARLDSYWSVFA